MKIFAFFLSTAAAASATLALAQQPAIVVPPAPAPAPASRPAPPVATKAEIRVEFQDPAVAPAPAKRAVVAPAQAPARRVADGIMAAPAFKIGPAPAPGPANEAQLESIAREVLGRIRPSFRAELRLLTSACQPTPAQRREIALEAGRAAKEAAKKLAVIQQALQGGGWMGGAIPDARQVIREAMKSGARARLASDQLARYEAELERRTHDVRQAIAMNLVANFDKLLVLAPEQRESLVASMLAHWDERSYPSLETLQNYEFYLPAIPDAHVSNVLNEAQRKAWNGVQKVTFGQGFDFLNGVPANGAADEPEDPDVKAALAEEPKP